MRNFLRSIADVMESGSSSATRPEKSVLRCIPLILSLLVMGSFGASRAHAATSLPCDIYNSAGTPCVAAHSTTRALYANYSGPLYQVYRSSDATTLDIGVMSVGGYANASAQDSFCANTQCIISKIYDQSPQHNDLLIEGGGGANPNNDIGAPADALAVTAGGHAVYGIEISAGMGYRNNNTTGVATAGKPEGMYMVTSGTHVNAPCCFDYGNAEINSDDNGNGHMDALNFGTECYFTPCSGNGPWVLADMENGLFESDQGYSKASNYTGNPQPFVTAMLKNNGQNHFALHSADATTGGLFTIWDGGEPTNQDGYSPMKQEGAIVLGTGGDNSNGSIGSFFEGVMTAGYPSDDADNAVQANIVSVGYTTTPVGGSNGTLNPGSEISLRATTACCTGDYIRHQNGNVVISAISSGSSLLDRSDATWIVRRGLANNSCISFESKNYPGDYIRHQNSVLFRQPYDGTTLNASDATFCPVGGNNGQGNSFQSVNFTNKYIRHYNSTGYIASNGGSNSWDSANSWTDDTSWIVSAPLAN